MGDLNTSLNQYQDQLSMVNHELETANDENKQQSLLALKSDLQQLIQLTQESLDAISKHIQPEAALENGTKENKNDLDEEYALFMQEMAETDAYNANDKQEHSESANDSDIEDELASLPGMKCAVYYTHKWGGQPSLHNAMVSSIVPRQDDDQFKDLQVRVLFTHPTHAEMLPCPFFLNGECRFNDEQCRYSHGLVTHLSTLKEAIEPNFGSIKTGSRVLIKLKPPDDAEISLTKKASEKYHLWHRAVVKSINSENKTCVAKLEHRLTTGAKRKVDSDEYNVNIEEIYPLTADNEEDSDSSDRDSLSDTEYPDAKTARSDVDQRAHLIENSLLSNAPAMGQWEQHTRGIGSKIMLAMGYVPGTGLGATGEGRVQPVEARVLPVGKSLDQCMAISEKHAAQDPLKVEQKLKRLQKREEERNKRAYEREKERERRNVFNFINRTLGDKPEQETLNTAPAADVKQSSSKDLNIEQFKITEDTKKVEREIIKLNNSLIKYPTGSNGHRSINMQIIEKNKELSALQIRERDIVKEQRQRKDKQKMTVF